MEDYRPSGTAIMSALMRAAHFTLDGDPKILKDDLAMGLTGIPEDHPLNLNSPMHKRPEFRKLRAHMVLRNRFTEDTIADRFLTQHGAQYVILGAGLDSFAYRRPGSLMDVPIFEVDHPATQKWKQTRLDALHVSIPLSVKFVPVDFERDNLTKLLVANGFDRSKPVVFSWLGVSQYLRHETINAFLRELADCSAASRMLVMDFVLPESTLGPEDQHQINFMRMGSERTGEHWLSYYTPDELRMILTSAGFDKVDHISPEQSCTRYLSGRTDNLTLSGAYHLMTASCGEMQDSGQDKEKHTI